MPLESPGFLSQLVATNPAHSDQLNQADSHLRLIKSALLATFPNWTSAALNSTQAQIDAAVAAVVNGVGVFADAGVFFKTNTHDGFSNPTLGEIDVILNNILSIKFTSDGTVAAAKFVGKGVVPIGGSMMWFEDALPNAVYGDYAWLNGQLITGANTRCPELLARWGSTFGGDGITTMKVPDTREAAPYGKSTMGGTTTPGRITNYALTTLAGFFGTCLNTLLGTNLPPHTHTAAGNTGTESANHNHNFQADGAGGVTGASYSTGGASAGNNGTAATGIENQSHFHSFSVTTDAGTGTSTPVNNVGPGFVCNWVVRLA